MVKQMIIMSVLAMMPFIAKAQECCVVTEQADSLLVPAKIVNNLFYTKDLPMDISKVNSIQFLKVGNNASLAKFTMIPDFVIPKEWEKYEIPRNRVKYLAEIEEQSEAYQQMHSFTKYDVDTDTLVGKPLPEDFSLYDLNGNLWTKQALKGHKVVVNAWFSSCGPCLREMPILSEWKTKYPDVIFLSVNFEKADKVRKIIEERGFNWTHIYCDDYFVKFVGTSGFPLFIVIGEDGLVHYIKNGTNEKIRQDILEVIEEQ